MIKSCVLIVLLATFVCGGNVISLDWLEDEGSSFADEICNGRNESHFTINTRGCSWFWYCNSTNYAVSQGRCPLEYPRFNYVDQTCDFYENVPCELDDTLPVYSCPENSPIVTYIPHPYSCSMYTVCFAGYENDRECEEGKHFSFHDRACVETFEADCRIDLFKCKESIETGVPVFLPNPRDCGSFFVCTNATSTILRCAPGYHYVPALNRCLQAATANCTAEVDDGPTIPDQTTADCSGLASGNLPHPESCQFYFVCIKEVSLLQSCGADLIFDTKTLNCLVPSDALCILDVPTEPPTDPPATTPEDTTPEETTLADTTFEDTTLAETTLEDTTLEDSTLEDTTLAETTLDDTTLEDTTLAETTLDDTTLEDTTLAETTLEDTTLDDTTDIP